MQAAREKADQVTEQKLATAAHEAAVLRTKLEAKAEAARAAEAQVCAVRAHARLVAEAHQSAINALQEKLTDARRSLDEVRRRATVDLEAAEAKGEAKAAAAAETAVARHQRRIQDLELQLAHATGAAAFSVPAGAHTGGVPGGYIASVLDYIPRNEHLRLLEARGAVWDAEARAQLAAVRAQAAEDAQARVNLTSKELQEVRQQLEETRGETAEQKGRAARAEHLLALLRSKCGELEAELELAKQEAAQQAQQAQDQAAQLAGALGQAQQALAGMAQQEEAAKVEAQAAHAARVKSESVAAAALQKSSQLQTALAVAESRCDDLAAAVERLQGHLDATEAEKAKLHKLGTAAAAKVRKLQDRCADIEAQLDTAQRQLSHSRAEADSAKAAAAQAYEEARVRSQDTLHAVLSQLETSLGIQLPPSAASSHQGQTGNRLEARVSVVASRCREMLAEAAAQGLAAQQAQQGASALAAALSSAQARCAAAEQQWQAIQEQYAGDMAALEHAARDQLHSVRAHAEEAIAGVEKATTRLHERLSQQATRAGSLAEEVEGLRARLAQQAEQLDKEEGKERAVADLLQELASKQKLI